MLTNSSHLIPTTFQSSARNSPTYLLVVPWCCIIQENRCSTHMLGSDTSVNLVSSPRCSVSHTTVSIKSGSWSCMPLVRNAHIALCISGQVLIQICFYALRVPTLVNQVHILPQAHPLPSQLESVSHTSICAPYVDWCRNGSMPISKPKY